MTQQALLSSVSEIRLEMDGTYMNVIRFGAGEKALAILSGISLCGLEGQGAAVAQSYAAFADRYTVYLFDRKKVLPEGYLVTDMAEDVYRALTQLGVTECDVYGVSQGGMMGQALALAHPGFVRRLALCSTHSRALAGFRQVADRWLALAGAADVVGLNRCFFEVVYSPAFLDLNRAALPVLEKLGTPEDCRRFLVLVHACLSFDVYDRLSGLTCPVLLMAGDADHVIPVESTRELAAALGCEPVIYPGCSHAVFDEQPDVKDRLLAFLSA